MPDDHCASPIALSPRPVAYFSDITNQIIKKIVIIEVFVTFECNFAILPSLS